MQTVETWIRNARVVTPDGVLPRTTVVIRGKRIHAVGTKRKPPKTADALNAAGALLGPGLVDVHINGAFGIDFSEATPDEIHEVSHALLGLGVTGFVPTLISLPKKTTIAAIRRIAEAPPACGARILGLHLEGPYLNPVRRGAHVRRNLRKPSLPEFREFLKASDGRLKMMTIAPELPGADKIIRLGKKRGMLMCAGHSDATRAQMDAAIRAGIRHVTHQYNAMRPFHHREEGILDRSLVDDRVSCSMIYDRRHISRSAAELVLRSKPDDRAVLVSDAVALMGNGRTSSYRVGGRLGGSVASLLDAVRFLGTDLDLPPERLFQLAAANPSRILGLPSGVIAPGRPADLVLFDKTWKVRAAFVGGTRWR